MRFTIPKRQSFNYLRIVIEIDDKILSLDIFEKKFVCDLNACKGACCVEGDAGAPLELNEVDVLEDAYPEIKPFMRKEGIAAVEQEGVFYMDIDNEPVTTLVNDKECAFAYFEENGTAKCAIEKANNEGATDALKPISCHLYPIRTRAYTDYEAVNYHEWPICAPACDCGDKLDVKVYKFLKAPIIRKWGVPFFKKLEEVDRELHK